MTKQLNMQIEDKTYRYRLSFRLPRAGIISDDKEDEVDQRNERLKPDQEKEPYVTNYEFPGSRGYKIDFGCFDAKAISLAEEFDVSEGGFNTPEAAWEEAKSCALDLLLLAADQQFGVDIGTVDIGAYSEDKAKPGDVKFSEDFFGDLPTKERRQPIVHKRGITVVEQPAADYGSVSIKIRGQFTSEPFSPFGFLHAWSRIGEKKIQLTDETTLALELYNAGFFETSYRARFITWILMLESLAKPKKRSAGILVLINKLHDLVKNARTEFSNDEDLRSIQGIASSLCNMRNESITQSLERLIESATNQDQFMDLDPIPFIKKCYKTRSHLVHDGTSGISEPEFILMVDNLSNLAAKVIRHILGIEKLSIPPEDRASDYFRFDTGV